MRIALWCACVAVLLAPVPVWAQSGWGQFQLVNQTSQTVDLYIDDGYGCRALAGLTCETMVTEGGHVATAKGQSTGENVVQPFEMESGATFTFTVHEETAGE
jgi:hypothetical protein